jgi:hypothetical protein
MGAVDALNRLLTAVFDIGSRPFLAFPPIWALTLLSLVAGVLLVAVFGRISNQHAIRTIRERIRGNLLGIHIYRHEIGVILRLQGRVVRDSLASMGYMVVPMLVVLVPLVLVLAQLNLRFAVRPLLVGETAIVKARVRSPASLDEPITLMASSSGAEVETPGVRIPSEREVAWRVRATEPGRHLVAVRIGGEVVEKVLVVGAPWGSVSQRRTGGGLLDVLLYPGEPPIPTAFKIESVDITHPALSLSVLGVKMDWLVLFLLLSTAFGFMFKGALGVEL